MAQLMEIIGQYGAIKVEDFVDMVARQAESLGQDAWDTVWKSLGDKHGHEARDSAYAHAVSRGHIHATTF